MSAGKEIWFCRMKTYWLDNTFGLRERSCWCAPAQTVNHHLTWCLYIVGHRSKVISFHMPHYFTYNMLKFHFDLQFTLIWVVIKHPLNIFFFLIISFRINIIFKLPLLKKIRCLFWKRFAVKLWLNYINKLFIWCT